MIVEIYLIGCLFAFGLGWIQANKELQAGYDISQFGAVIIIITILSWIYVAYWLLNNFDGGPRVC